MTDPKLKLLERRHSPRWLAPVVWTILAVGILPIFCITVIHVKFSLDLRSCRAAYHKAGHPLSLSELKQRYYSDIKPEDNGADFLTNAFEHINLKKLPKKGIPLWLSNELAPDSVLFSEEGRKQATQILALNSELLNSLHNIPPAAEYRYPLDFEMGFNMLMPHLRRIPEATQLLLLEAVMNAKDRKSAAAMDDLRAAFRLSQSLMDEPFLISQLVRMRCHQMLASSLQSILNQQPLQEAQLIKLSEYFNKEENPQAMKRALEAETCSTIYLFESSVSQKTSTLITPFNANTTDPTYEDDKWCLVFLLMRVTGFDDNDQRFFLENLTKYLKINEMGFPDKLNASNKLIEQIKKEALKRGYICSSMLLPSIGKGVARETEDCARMNIVQSVIAIERYRIANQNRLPEKLDDLVPAFLKSVPDDPFDGKPLRYKTLATGYVIYSIGDDRKDDGGTRADPKKPGGPGDIVFTVER